MTDKSRYDGSRPEPPYQHEGDYNTLLQEHFSLRAELAAMRSELKVIAEYPTTNIPDVDLSHIKLIARTCLKTAEVRQ